jgi:para-nitrobenzyl esterase
MRPTAIAVVVASGLVVASACSHPPGGADTSPDAANAAGSSGSPGACPVAPSSDPLVVATDKGLVKGTQVGSGYAVLGIPFAAPPVGALRFMPPAPAACWSDVVDATQYGATCAQIDTGTGGVLGSEDCLNVNVWTPALPSATGKPRPVLVWIYGGGDIIGVDSYAPADGQALAVADDAIVVAFNYRLGALGFLALPALAAANPQHTTGNYGLLDAIAALQWVQANAAAFGGDPSHVLLFGQSAGAINTCALVASPLAHGLFTSALMESGNCAAETLSYRYPRGEVVATAAGCALAPDVAACLQSAPLSSIVQGAGATFIGSVITEALSTSLDAAHLEDLPFAPTVDGYVLDDTPEATIRAGNHNHVPLVIGTNAREFGSVLPPALIPNIPLASCGEYAAIVAVVFPGIAVPLLQHYPCNVFDATAGYRALVALLTDAFFACPSRRALRGAAATQTEPVYRYLFSHGAAAHTDEVPYVFDTFATEPYTPDPAEVLLSQQIQTYWGNLAATGNPNGAAVPTWPAYASSADDAVQLDTPIGATADVDNAACDFWDSVQ